MAPLYLAPLCALSFVGAGPPPSGARQAQPEAIIAYVFVKDRVIQPGEIAARELTRINYAFANLRDGEMVEGFPHDAENFAALLALKADNPRLQVMVSVGGWTWSGGFSAMALTAETRARFIASAVKFIERYQLDGLDIDWEYPGLPGIGNPFLPEDGEHYTALLTELRAQFDLAGRRLRRRLLLSVAAGAGADFLAHTDMRRIAREVDSVNLMSYDYYESSSSATTGHHAPLFTNPADPRRISTSNSVAAYLAAGVPPRKLVLGVPFYGHAWGETGPASNGLFQPGKAVELDTSYRNIVANLLNSGFVRYWDAAAQAPYLYNAETRTFITYEDPESVARKCRYVRDRGLGGVMFWDYESDANHTLLDAIFSSLQPRRAAVRATRP